MEDQERVLDPTEKASVNEERQLDSNEEDSKWNSDEESMEFDFYFGSSEWDSDDESKHWDSDENCIKMQFILPIDKGYTSVAKSLLYGIVRSHYQMSIDDAHTSQNTTSKVILKVFSLLTSDSFLCAIENGDAKAVREFLRSSWTFYARRLKSSCVESINRKFLLQINNNLNFAERALNLAARNRNGKAFSLIASALFFEAVKNSETRTVKRFLNCSRNERSMRSEIWCAKVLGRQFKVKVDAFDMACPLGSCISYFDWLESIYIAHCDVGLTNVLFKDVKFLNGVTQNGWTTLHMAMFQFQSEFGYRERVILQSLLKCEKFDVNALTDSLETVLHFACRCSVSNDEFTLFLVELLKLRINVNQKNSKGETALMIACKTGNVAAVREILKWRNDIGEKPRLGDNRDKAGEGALWFAKQSNNAEIIAMIDCKLFLRAVKHCDTETVKFYLNALHEDHDRAIIGTASDWKVYSKELTRAMEMLPSKESYFEGLYCITVLNNQLEYHYRDHSSEEIERLGLPGDEELIEEPQPKRFKAGVETQLTSKRFLTHSIWLEAVTIARHKRHDEALHLLFNYIHFFQGVNENGSILIQKAVEKYLAVSFDLVRLSIIEIVLKFCRPTENNWNLQNEAILEIICKIEPPEKERLYIQLYNLLRILFYYGIDLNGRNKNSETPLMLACEKERIDIVRGLINLTSHGFILDIDAVDNSGETALMKAERNNNSEILALMIRIAFRLAIEDNNENIVKFMLNKFFITSYTFDILWNSEQRSDNRKDINVDTFKIWRYAMYLTMQNVTEHRKEILELLLDHVLISNHEDEIGHQLVEFGRKVDSKRLRLIEILLQSGKINVNARCESGKTMLHLASNAKLASLLIRYGADVNKEDNNGRTPLMTSLGSDVSVLRTILSEAGALVDLDAVDYSGRTALMNAAMWEYSDAVELLLKAGASVNVSNHIGFTTLHHALYGDVSKRDEFPLYSEELKIRKEIMAILFDVEEHHENCIWYRENKESNKRRMKIVEMLLLRSDVDVNVLSFEKISPLDIGESWFPQIPSSVRESLKEKGAALSAFLHIEAASISNCRLDDRSWSTFQEFVYYAILECQRGNTKYFNLIKERFLTYINTYQNEFVSGKDKEGRTALHLVVILFVKLISKYRCSNERVRVRQCVRNLGNAIVKQLTLIGCNENTTDIYGLTPFQYNRDDSQCSDINYFFNNYAISPVKLIVRSIFERSEKALSLRLINSKEMKIHFQNSNPQDKTLDKCLEQSNNDRVPELLWIEGKYAFRHPSAKQITEEVKDLVGKIAKEIEKQNSKFEIRPELVGSSTEGTKIDEPDEFDFCFILTKISELCEVSQSPELPTGFVRLKRKSNEQSEPNEFDGVFMENGILNTEKLNWQFKTALNNALNYFNNQQNSEWNLRLLNPSTDEEEDPYRMATPRIDYKFKKTSNIHIYKRRIANCRSISIDIDIVPCIHIDGWWPDEAISNVSDDIKKFGCNLIFDRPQNLYPWVPYSESCARISFSKAECNTIENSLPEAREAYMIGKTIIEKSEAESQYILKNSLLYCIEALTPTSEKASKLRLSLEEFESKFRQIDRHLWLKCLMKCHLEFVSQDFCPTYFMQTLSSPIGKKYLKQSSSFWIDNEFTELCKKAYAFYRCASDDSFEFCCQLPAPDPLWERFDRDSLISSLFEIAYKI